MKKKLNEIKRLSPDIKKGLTSLEVKERIENKMTNAIKTRYSKSLLNIFLSNIFTFFNLLGLCVALALIYIHAEKSRFFFAAIYIANTLIGIIQEIRAKSCIDRLSLISSKKTTVIRDGKEISINNSEIVLDDIIILSLGDQIPTDSILIQGNVEVNESLITGETLPVKKNKNDLLFSGSYISSGNCICRAYRVGQNNYVQILSSKAKKYKKPHSEIMDSITSIIRTIAWIIIPFATAFILKSYIPSVLSNSEFNLTETIDKTSTVIIGMIPSGMFLLTSLALAVGILKLAKQNTLVQDLYSLEMLARIDTICFDKTGTLTDGNMAVNDIIELCENDYDIKNIMPSILQSLNDKNPTSLALKKYFGVRKQKYKPSAIIPFNSKIKLSAVSFLEQGTFAFGAPEFVLTKQQYKILEKEINQYAKLGQRILLLVHSPEQIVDEKLPTNLTPISLIVLSDNIRKEAIDTVKWFQKNDVEIKVISGDNTLTVSEISKRVGIKGSENCISLEGFSDEEVYNVANKYTIFGRVTPEQKEILIKALKESGHITAMTGDGVNDILAMRQADCAITVASGSSSTKNIANIVLLDNNFNSMPKVVFEGRRVINNIKSSSSLYLMKTIFTMVLSLIVLFIPNSHYPFNLSQMLLLEILILGIAPFFLSLQPNKEKVSGKFINSLFEKSVPAGALMVLSVLLSYLSKIIFIHSMPYATNDIYITVAVVCMTCTGLVNLFMICRPFNVFRTTLFTSIFFVTAIILEYIFINGSKFLSLTSLTPFKLYWRFYLLIVFIIIIDIATFLIVQSVLKKNKQKITK